MALTFFWRCEGATLDHPGDDFSVGDITANLVTATIGTGAARIGTNGLDCPTASNSAQFDSSGTVLVDRTEGAIGFWVRANTSWPVANQWIAWADDGTGQNYVRIGSAGSGNVRLQIGTATGPTNISLNTTGGPITTGNWFFIIGRWNHTANSRAIEVYDNAMSLDAGSTEDLITSWTLPTADLADTSRPRFGDLGGTDDDLNLDNIFIADAYDEPIEDNALIESYTQYGVSAGSGKLRPQAML